MRETPESAMELTAAMLTELDNIRPDDDWTGQTWVLHTASFLGYWTSLDKRLERLERGEALADWRANWKAKIGPALRTEADELDLADAKSHWPMFSRGFAGVLSELRLSFPLAMNGNELWATPELIAAAIPVAKSIGELIAALPDWPLVPGLSRDWESGMDPSVIVQTRVSALRRPQLPALSRLISVATAPLAGVRWSLMYGGEHRKLEDVLRSLWRNISGHRDSYGWENYKDETIEKLQWYLRVLAEIVPAEASSTT